jgi:hypothetical protein
VLVTRGQPSLWDAVLPAEVRRLSPLLERVDRWLDDEGWPPTAATARPASTDNSKTSAFRPWRSRARASPARPANRWSTHPLPRPGQMAHRMRGPHRAPQTPLRLGPQPRRRTHPHRHLVRLRSPRPQPRQGHPDRGHHRMKPATSGRPTHTRSSEPQARSLARRHCSINVRFSRRSSYAKRVPEGR